MSSSDKDIFDRLSTILSLVVSIVAILSVALYGKTEAKIRWWVYAVALAIIGLTWLGWFIYRRYKRKRLLKRVILQRSDEGKPIGFNGALAYTQDDCDRFFGRENDIVSFLAQIKQDDYRYGVLYGESGVGKTSFIQAGIIPRMGNEYQCFYISLNNLPRIETEAAAKDVEKNLFFFILSQAIKKLSLTTPVTSFSELIQKVIPTNKKAAIFFLDQFEQIFDRMSEKRCAQFATVLQHSKLNKFPLQFVISVRSDYFHLVYQLLELEKRFSYLLSRFNAPQAREVIRCSYGLAKKLEETKPDHLLLDFEDEIIADLEDTNGRIHPVEISLICWIILRAVGELTRVKYLEGGCKQGWLDRYMDDVLQPLPNKKQALQVLSSLIRGDKSDILSVNEISIRSSVSIAETQKILNYFEQSKLIVKEWS